VVSNNFAAFWPRYLADHSRPATRAFHAAATLAELSCLAGFLVTHDWRWLVALPLVGYGLAWFSHFAIERNRPATWQHPLWSWLADHKMMWLLVTGRLPAELARHEICPSS
jgi:hypothetical protein